MTTRELYSSIGTSGYEHQDCWRKGEIFHIRMEAPQSCHKCPKCGDRNVIHRGRFDRMVHAPRIGLDQTVLFIRAPRRVFSWLENSTSCRAVRFQNGEGATTHSGSLIMEPKWDCRS